MPLTPKMVLPIKNRETVHRFRVHRSGLSSFVDPAGRRTLTFGLRPWCGSDTADPSPRVKYHPVPRTGGLKLVLLQKAYRPLLWFPRKRGKTKVRQYVRGWTCNLVSNPAKEGFGWQELMIRIWREPWTMNLWTVTKWIAKLWRCFAIRESYGYLRFWPLQAVGLSRLLAFLGSWALYKNVDNAKGKWPDKLASFCIASFILFVPYNSDQLQ